MRELLQRLARSLVPTTRALALLLAVAAAIGLAKADTMTVMGDDVTICSSATSLDQLGIATLTGTINFYTPSGCSAGDKLVFTKLEMLESGGNTAGTKQEATTISITVNGVKYTSSPVVKSSAAPSSLGNLTTIENYKLLTYTFPNVIVEAGASYPVSFNGSGLTELRCRMESTASGTVFTAPTNGNWKPYGVITAAPVLTSTPLIGSRIILGNTGTSGAISDSGAGESNFSISIPSFTGLPEGSVLRVKNVSLASWNDTSVWWDTTNKKCDPYFVQINNIRSKSIIGTSTTVASPATISLTGSKIQSNASTTHNRLFFEYADTCDLTVGTSYSAASGNSYATGFALIHGNGSLIWGSSPGDCGGVRYVEAATASVLSSTAATGAYPIYEMLLEVVSKPAQTATIDAEGTYTLEGLFSGTASDGVYQINVNESATLDIDAAATVDHITFNIASGKTLTLTGNTLTASEIAFTGDGVAATQNMSMFSGTLTGDGTLCYDMNNSTTKPSGIVCTSDDWVGMLWIKNGAYTGWNFNTADTGYIKYGSANSTLRLENVTCFLNATETVDFTLDLHGDGLKITNGSQYRVETVKKLTGSGTLAISGGSANGNGFIIQDGSEFAGSINITTGNYVVNFADSGTYANSTTGGKIIVGSGKTATVASGKTWSTTNKNGIEINGTLTLADSTSTLTGTISGSGTLVANQQFPVPGSSFTGTLTINGDAQNGTTTDATAIYGSTLNVASGQVGVTGNVTKLPDTINIASGAFFVVMNASLESLSLGVGTWDGTLAFIDCTSLASLTIDAGTKRAFPTTGNTGLTLPNTATLSTVNIVLDEVKGEGGTIALTSVTGLTAVEGRAYNFTVNCLDGRTVAGTYDSATSTITYTPSISGAACWYDFTFTNTVKSATGSSGSSTSLTTTDVSSFEYVTIQDYAQPTPNSYTAIPTYVRPYSGINLGSKTQFCVALFGTMPSPDNTVLLFLGDGQDGGALILASGTSANEAVLYYYTTGTGKVLKELKRMPASSCRTAPHLYVFQKVGDHQVDIYLDGKLNLSYVNNDITFTLNTGFQVASGYKSTPTGLSGISSSATTESSAIAMTRIYDRLLTSAEITQLATEWPYYSPNGDSSRTLDVGETTPDWVDTGKWLFNNVGADAAAANSNVELVNNAGATASVAVNLNANTAYESLAVSGDNAASFALKSGFTGKIVPGSATFSADTTVAYDAADFSSTRIEVADGKTLIFDVSSIVTANGNWPNAASVDRIQLTGIATLGTGATVAVTPATAGYWNLSAVEDGGYYYLSVAPNRATGEIYWQSGTYWNSTYNLTGSNPDNPAVFTTDAAGQIPTKYFAGDTVVIPTTTQRYFGPVSDGAAIKFDCGDVINVTKTDSLGYVFKNATVTVASGTTLNFVNSWNGTAPVVYGGTISGAGKVKVESGKTLTLSNGATLASETALTGAGEVVLASVPTSQMAFDNWTGIVSLPSFAAAGHNLNSYGVSGSTVAISGMTGWIGTAGASVAANLRLDGNLVFSAMSYIAYSFKTISGSGDISFNKGNNDGASSVAIAEIASGYSGTVKNATDATVTIARLSLASAPAAGEKILKTENTGNGSIAITAVYVDGVATPLDLEYKDDGVYVSEFQGIGYWTDTTLTITNTAALVEIPASATAATVYPSSSVVTLTGGAGLTSSIAVMAKYEGGEQDIESAFTTAYNEETGTTTMTFNGSATVTVEDETISVTPALAASEPVALTEAKPSFAVKTIPGLWYSLESCDSATGSFTAESTVQATGTTTSLNATATPNPVKYYKLGVDVAEP